MSQSLQAAVKPSPASLAKAFFRLGWAGFWIQVVFGSLLVLLMVYYFAFSGSAGLSRSGLPFVEILTAANLLVLVFTTFWSFRYTRLSRRLAASDKRPGESYVTRFVWTGVVASTAGMLLTVIVMFLEAASLLYRFLKAPQAGVPMIQVAGSETVYHVSAGDMVSLIALILTLLAQLIVLVFGLWLLSRTIPSVPEAPRAVAG
jgi:hypothetical protein